jgi:DNA primase
VLDEMAAPLAAVTDPGARSVYIRYLAETVDIDEAAILEKIGQAAVRNHPPLAGRDDLDPARTTPRHQKPLDNGQPGGSRIERQVVAMMLNYQEILPEVRKRRVADYIEAPLLKQIALETLGEPLGEAAGDVDQDLKMRTMAQLSVGDEKWEYKRCLDIINQLLAPGIRARATALDRQIRDAEQQQDQELLLKLLQERKQLAETKQQMHTAGYGERL